MYDNKDTNHILMTGHIRSIYDDPETGKTYIRIVSSKTIRDKHVRRSVRFQCTNEAIQRFRLDDRVSATGHFINIRYNRSDGSEVTTQQAYLDTLRRSETRCEEAFGVRGKFSENPDPKIYVAGRVEDVTQERGWLKYLVAVPGKETGGPTTISLSMKVPDRMPNISAGDDACFVGTIFTAEKEVSGKMRWFEDLLIDDLAKVPGGGLYDTL